MMIINHYNDKMINVLQFPQTGILPLAPNSENSESFMHLVGPLC